jgi:hypothetical protein
LPNRSQNRLTNAAFALARAISPKPVSEAILADWQETLSDHLRLVTSLGTAAQVLAFALRARLGQIASTAVGKTCIWLFSLALIWFLTVVASWALVPLAVAALQFAKGDLRVDLVLSRRALTFAQITLISLIALANIQVLALTWLQWQGPSPAEHFIEVVELGISPSWFTVVAQATGFTAVISAWLAAFEVLTSLRRKRSWSALVALVWVSAATSIAIWLFLRAFPLFTWIYRDPEIQRTLGNTFIAFAALMGLLIFGLTLKRNRAKIKEFVNYHSALAGLAAVALTLIGIQQATATFPTYVFLSQRPIVFDNFRNQMAPELQRELATTYETLAIKQQAGLWHLSHDATYRAASSRDQVAMARRELLRVWDPSAVTPSTVLAFVAAISDSRNGLRSSSKLTKVHVEDDLTGYCESPVRCLLRFSATNTWTELISSVRVSRVDRYQVELKQSEPGWRLISQVSWALPGSG